MTQITNPDHRDFRGARCRVRSSALQSGSVGMIYQQFAMTIAISMAFSAFLALSLTPALCATLLRPEHLKENTVFRLFNRGYSGAQGGYLRSVKFSLSHQRWWLAGFAVLLIGGAFLFTRVPRASYRRGPGLHHRHGDDAARHQPAAHARVHARRQSRSCASTKPCTRSSR
jgi:hypothetical protein